MSGPIRSAPIRTGVIGYGLSGRVFHTPFLAADPNFVIDLIATGNPDRQAQATAHHPGATIVDTPEQLLARAGDLDLVVLASPPHTHLEQGLAALSAGAAIVIDKPFAPSVADAEQLIARSEEVGLPLAVFQNRRWDGDFLTVEKLLAEDRLGDIHRFESTFERWSPKLKPGWQDKISTAQGAGILFDLGSHLIDQALRLFGPVSEIHAEFSLVRHGGLTEDDAFLAMTHANGVHSHLTMSRVAAQVGPRFRVLGSDGGYRVYGLDGQEAALAAEIRPTDDGYGITPKDQWGTVGVVGNAHPIETEPGAYPEFYARLADAILNGAPVPVDPRESLEVVRIIEKAHEQTPLATRSH